MDERCFVQFPHPGGEHGPDEPNSSIKRWERGPNPHKRKFIANPGEWRSSPEGPSQTGEIRFWGEWEADSLVEPIRGERHRGYPAWLHRPFFEGAQNAPAGVEPQNTDPFVFGERFLYTFCRQDRNQRLRRLGQGSLILFGSRKDKEFVLDTVFVVSDSIDHTRANFATVAAPLTSPVFHAVTLDPMYAWPGVHGGRLYRSATARDPIDGMFGFVPCLPSGDGVAFARPAIRLPRLVKPTLAMAARTVVVDNDANPDAWTEVVSQVLAAGLVLGTYAELPGARSREIA